MSVISIGLSGMLAAQAQVQASAANIVHANSEGRIPVAGSPKPDDVYQPVDVVTFDVGKGGKPADVGYSYVPRPDSFSVVHDPDSPVANANGDVATPNVDLATEMVSMVQAKYQFYASAMVVRVGEQMLRATINMVA